MGKFLATFFVAILLIISITVVFDFSEKLDGFMGKSGVTPTTSQIIFDYYGNFIPYFANLFSPLFVFISVIFFTSRMASRLEIVSILSTGISYWRLLRPFLLAATLIAIGSFSLTNYVIPHANHTRIQFERTFLGKSVASTLNFHQQIRPGEMIYVERYDFKNQVGTKFSYEKIADGKLTYKLLSQTIRWDSTTSHWRIEDCLIRTFTDSSETFYTVGLIDTVLDFDPSFFKTDLKLVETMSNSELRDYIEREKKKGSKYIDFYLVEKHKRTANPFSTIILTLLAVPIASRKMRGGIGIHLAMGVSLAFAYIFMQRITTTYAVNGGWNPFLAVWIPNLVFIGIGLLLTRFAQK